MKRIIFYILIFIAFNMQSQTTLDTINLREVKLVESRFNTYKNSREIIDVDSHLIGYNNISISNYLNKNSMIFIKEYGALATPSFRGTSSSHSLILWNGIPINSIANGLSDLSILPINKLNNISIINGGNSSVFGSGSIGGTINIDSNNKIYFNPKKTLLINTEIGSYGFSSRTLSIEQFSNLLSVKLNINEINHQNNFMFKNLAKAGHPIEENNYGSLLARQEQIDLTYKFSDRQYFIANYWHTYFDREVQTNMTTPNSDAKQFDDNNRLLFTYKSLMKNIGLNLKQAYTREKFRYIENSKSIDSKYTAENYITDLDFKYYKSYYLFNVGMSFCNKIMINNNYIENEKKEDNYTIFSAVQYERKFLKINSVIRKEYQEAYQIPFTPLFSLDLSINKRIAFLAKYNRVFRSPTLNDRYWFSGNTIGNPNLKPENGWNQEIGLIFNNDNIYISGVLYSINIEDWILWHELDNGNWTADNIKKVWSRGFENKIQINYKYFRIITNYTYTKSTSQLPTSNLDYTVGKQLRYVPCHKANFSIIYNKNNFKLLLNQSYTSNVITNYGVEDKYLKGYMLTDISFQYNIASNPINLQLDINNFSNVEYQTYQNYARPGREYRFSINYILEK